MEPLGGSRERQGRLLAASALPHPSNKPATEAQVIINRKHKLLMEVLSRFSLLIAVGFKTPTKKNTSFNAAYSYNYERVFEGVGDVVSFDFSRFVYSRGDVATPNCASVATVEDGGLLTGIAFSWLPESESEYNRVTDVATFVVCSERGDFLILMRDAATRGVLGYLLELPELPVGERLHCFMCFRSNDGKRVGDSVWVGEVEG